MKHPRNIPIADYTYDLPAEKIALYPLQQRDEARLLIYKQGHLQEDTFRNISTFLESETLLVFNTTRVINARLRFLNSKEQEIELFCLEPDNQELEVTQAMAAQGSILWRCLVGNLKRWKEEELSLTKNGITLGARLITRSENYVLVEFFWKPETQHFSEVLEAIGHTPIPPYLKRESEKNDEQRYQTIYAKEQGSVAAPTAGLHFTEDVFQSLEEKGIERVNVTLHVGAGTFKPVKSEFMDGHEMHAEWMDVSRETVEILLRSQGKKIIAVGTTSLRTLESLYWMGLKAHLKAEATLQELEISQWEVYSLAEQAIDPEQSLQALLHWMDQRAITHLVAHTQILIAPPYELKMAQGIITNFHQPQSTLLLLISAVVGDKWHEIYTYALTHGFRFLSYGDSSLLLK